MSGPGQSFHDENCLWIKRYNAEGEMCWNLGDMIGFLISIASLNTACKIDEAWNVPGFLKPPFDDFEIHDYIEFMKKNGTLHKESPLVWTFSFCDCLLDILGIFIHADSYLIANIPFTDVATGHSDQLTCFDFWYAKATCFLTPSLDYSGLYFIAKDGKIVSRVKDDVRQMFSLSGYEVGNLENCSSALRKGYIF